MKHFKIYISVMVIFFSFFSMSTKAQSRYDVNSDGKVNITDAISVVNKILNGSSDNVNTPAEAVDLGLPSGTKWASYNLGASSPEDPGGRYAWGETQEKLVYTSSTYVHYDISTGKYRNIGNDICGTVYDAAHVKWGGSWHMPSQVEFEELVTFCTYEWTTSKGVKGGKFIGPNGNSIFLPINSSLEWNNNVYWLGYDDGVGGYTGYYGDQSNWFANCLKMFDYGCTNLYDGDCFEMRDDGYLIRPVYSNTSKTKMVDLGLPSGIKWASCNVGASCPEEVGEKYAWGETGEKSVYDWSTYMHCNGTAETCLNIGNDISGTKYDVAHVKWGGNWRMPTEKDFYELFNNCSKVKIYNGKKTGHLFTGPNGNSIFLPICDLWSGTLVEEYGDGQYSYFLYLRDLSSEVGAWEIMILEQERYEGLAVRPVYSPASPPASVDSVDLCLPSGTK